MLTDKDYESEIAQLQCLFDVGKPVEIDTVTDQRRQAIILNLSKKPHGFWSDIPMEDLLQFGELWNERIGCDDEWLVGLYNRIHRTTASPKAPGSLRP